MPISVIEQLNRSRFGFLRPDRDQILKILPRADEILPEPQLIFLDDEDAEPLVGFPILVSPKLRALEEALTDYLKAEEEAQFAVYRREPFDSRAYASRWESYRTLLVRVIENVTLSSYGGDYPAIFWLYHSLAVSRFLRETPQRLRRLELQVGREHGDAIKYKVFSKLLDRVESLSLETTRRLAAEMEAPALRGGSGETALRGGSGETEGEEAALLPEILGVMRENVLIFTEDDYVSPDLSELNSYFQGCLEQDGRDLRQRLARLDEWHRKNLQTDSVLRSALRHLVGADPDGDSRGCFARAGYLTFLSSHVTYSPAQLLSHQQIQLWESLLERIKRFEILCAMRKMMVPLEDEDGALISRDRSFNSTWVSGPSAVRVSHATRPMDFTSPWVVNPVVQRYGLVYDITDFSAILSRLGRAEKKALEQAFRMTSNFQRRVNQLASSLNLRLEKYLGDGAFYSGRNARHMLVAAIRLQRLYPEFLAKGFPFDSGLRIALNFGEYRLLPLAGSASSRDIRYEFFGQGLVELSRLSTGKRTQEVDDFKTYLIAQGYPERVVNKFFAPMTAKGSELVSKREEARRFYAYINQNGALVNEGIVATEAFIECLEISQQLHEDRHGYVVTDLDEGDGGPLWVGVRKLGIGKFKGLEPIPVYEVVDGGQRRQEGLKSIPSQRLTDAVERLFASAVTTEGQGPS